MSENDVILEHTTKQPPRMRIVFNLIFILDYNSFHIIKHKNKNKTYRRYCSDLADFLADGQWEKKLILI